MGRCLFARPGICGALKKSESCFVVQASARSEGQAEACTTIAPRAAEQFARLAAGHGYRYKTPVCCFSHFHDPPIRTKADKSTPRTSKTTKPATAAAPTPSTKPPGAGLEGIVATQSGICFIDGQAGK